MAVRNPSLTRRVIKIATSNCGNWPSLANKQEVSGVATHVGYHSLLSILFVFSSTAPRSSFILSGSTFKLTSTLFPKISLFVDKLSQPLKKPMHTPMIRRTRTKEINFFTMVNLLNKWYSTIPNALQPNRHSPNQDQYKQDQQDQSDTATWIESPVPAVGPSWCSTDDHQN